VIELRAVTSTITIIMPPKNLLLCFDAFGTLFKPKAPVPQQYAEVAKSLGLGGFSNDDVAASFKLAFKRESTENPNYGKATGLGAEKWWANIITNTFTPLIADSKQEMPQDLVPKLQQRFWGNEGYSLHPDVSPLIKRLRAAHRAAESKIVIGVITNSDDRVPDILTSLGLKVNRLRYGEKPTAPPVPSDDHDIDFTVLSYDVGYEKPAIQIFAAAEEVLQSKIDGEARHIDRDMGGEWRQIYVGDDYEKDIVGAVDAGWNAVLIDRETTRGRKEVSWLDPKTPGDLNNEFKSCKAVGFGSLAKFAEWLPVSK